MLVVSIDDANALFGTVTVVPLTKLEGKGRSPKLFEVLLPRGVIPNGLTPLALPHHIRSISKRRLPQRAGSLADRRARNRVHDGILDHLGVDVES